MFNEPGEYSHYQNFIVFEPSSLRISELDVLYRGDAVVEEFERILNAIHKSNEGLKMEILHNRLVKIEHMLELLQSRENVLITRFFARIWRRYGAVSHLGESLLDYETYLLFFPEYKKSSDKLLATRFDETVVEEEPAEETVEETAEETAEEDTSYSEEDKASDEEQKTAKKSEKVSDK